MTEKWDDPTTESLEKRGRKVREDGVVEGKAVPAIIFGSCIALGLLTAALVKFF